MRTGIRVALAFWIALQLAACGSGKNEVDEKNGGLSLHITDAPVDSVTAVVLQIRGIVVTRAEGSQEIQYDFPAPRQINVLEYQGGRATVLAQTSLPVSKFTSLRLIVDHQPNVRDSYVVSSTGEECELFVPTDAESGWEVRSFFSIPGPGRYLSLTIDVDLQRSLRTADCAAGYLFRPTLRLIDNNTSGWIEGEVDASLVTADCVPKVYVFHNTVVPEDMQEPFSGADPIVVVGVKPENGATTYRYRTPRLPQTSSNKPAICEPAPECMLPTSAIYYIVAFACGDDDPARDDPLTFSWIQAATVVGGTTTSGVNFPPGPR